MQCNKRDMMYTVLKTKTLEYECELLDNTSYNLGKKKQENAQNRSILTLPRRLIWKIKTWTLRTGRAKEHLLISGLGSSYSAM